MPRDLSEEKMKFAGFLIGILTVAVSLPAATINFAGGGNLGTSHTYGPVTATGYVSNGTTTALYGKGSAGATGSEDGLGLAADPTHDNEIFAPGTDFVQLDISGLSGLIKIAMSSTGGDSWIVFGSNSAGVLGTTNLASGGNDDNTFVTVLNATNYHYLDVTAHTNNVLLQQLSYTGAPEPGAISLMGGGLVAVAALIRRRRKIGASSK
jgi:hypothetical protein